MFIKSFFHKKSLFLMMVVLATFSLSGCIFKKAPPEQYKVDLEVWGIFDDSDAYNEVFGEYRKINPYIGTINYRKLPLETYKDDLLNALAAGNGPDIFMIRNAWRGSFEDKVAPAPDYLLTEKQYRDTFVDVVASDFISNGKIYGAPLSVDSLALYYNKDLFNAAGITDPPATWEELLSDVSKLNRVDQFGNINQSAVALGTAYNINRSVDLLTVLMFQMGGGILQPTFGKRVEFNEANSQKALEFYTQFARIGSGVYAWNPTLHYSIDRFYEGTLGMMINYSWHYATIKQKNAKLNFAVAPLPQFSGAKPVDFANYWGFAVAKNKSAEDAAGQAPAQTTVKPDLEKQNYLRIHEAWQFLNYLTLPHLGNKITLQNGAAGTTKEFALSFDPAEKYLEKTQKPAARRDLIEKQKNNVMLAPFAMGNLIAKNWYQGNIELVEAIFAETINAVNNGEKNVSDALTIATNRVNVLNR
jgi:ABC-type glycerol-3-phosphate transport system substrate-binding protein